MSDDIEGPWHTRQPEYACGWWVIYDKDDGEVGSGDGGYSEQQAKIISAAPDLIDALREISKQDPVELALDPEWAQRIARITLTAAGLDI